ncbi:unnamed protein product [Nesidiocoris tenuis]|uniref:Uncharacterized protein n=1 Tax=Nesidiocoris tenuis TaxID=355587 RepID=A0A6H5HLR1_9HEMI|nr:unnamed protein product [Nesidiocoris tenuis]
MDGIPPLQERSGQKRGCIDDIIDHMTAEFGGGYEGQYIQFLNGPPQPMPPQVANSQPPSTSQHPQAPWPAPPGVLSPGGIPGSPTAAPPVYYPQSGELGMMDVGNGNFVVYQTKPAPDFGATQPVGFIHYPAPQPLAQPQGLSAPQPPHLIDYSAPRPFSEQIQANGGCLIENVVGNWAPNRNGTYSPFGGLRGQDEPISGGTNQQQNVAVVPPVARSQTTLDQQQSPLSAPTKKPRIVAEASRLISSGISGKAHSVLKRQNSSGSEEALLEKVKIPVSRWSSAEDLTSAPPTRAQDQQKKEKKKRNYKSQTPFSESQVPVPTKRSKNTTKVKLSSYTRTKIPNLELKRLSKSSYTLSISLLNLPEPDIEDLLNSLYSQNGASGRSKKKSKKNK